MILGITSRSKSVKRIHIAIIFFGRQLKKICCSGKNIIEDTTQKSSTFESKTEKTFVEAKTDSFNLLQKSQNTKL